MTVGSYKSLFTIHYSFIMNPLSDLERLVAAIEKQGANIAPTYQEYTPIAFAIANDCGKAGGTFFTDCSSCVHVCVCEGGVNV